MLIKYIGFQLDLKEFNSIQQIIQMKDGYVLYGEETLEQKLKSLAMKLSNQKLLYFEIAQGQCISQKPYQIGQGLQVLSNIVSNENQIIALISRQGVRSLVEFNPKEHTKVYLIPNIPYKQYQIDCEASYKAFAFPDRVTLLEIYMTNNGVYVECSNHPNPHHNMKKFKKDSNISAFQIYNTNQIIIIADEEFYLFDGKDDIFSINIQIPQQFKIKFILEIDDQYIIIMKDRIDKFYKFCNKGNDIDYFNTMKCKELIDGTVGIDTQKKQSLNLTKFKNEYYIWISTIYSIDQDQKVLYINQFKISNTFESTYIQSFKLWKSQSITFVQKDEFVHEYLLYRDQQTIKAVYICI